MAKNMPVPNTIILNGRKTIGNQSHIFDISGLLLGDIYCKVKYSEIAAVAASFLLKPSDLPLIFSLGCNERLGGFGYAEWRVGSNRW
ncbi:hypothetical protein MVG78_07315 [Roseomonas gilardii subsp. gilardii]|uniref:hypothetical protein n=1 Tax=Roseomonas gilardii TaxID=257708 RepID=UPI001FF8E7EE|nr:hypothetical protein [Roseomonas gilardii]UPG73932.1 hypothetical protein MVG78_07315 [Roseomonas gilardii subsp. gilardii]